LNKLHISTTLNSSLGITVNIIWLKPMLLPRYITTGNVINAVKDLFYYENKLVMSTNQNKKSDTNKTNPSSSSSSSKSSTSKNPQAKSSSSTGSTSKSSDSSGSSSSNKSGTSGSSGSHR
jgi:hypothetical protein